MWSDMIILPYELFEEILAYALDTHPSPLSILTVHSSWTQAALPIFHSHLQFTSIQHLDRFVKSPGKLQCAPRGRSVQVKLAGGTISYGLWVIMEKVLSKCEHSETRCCRGVKRLQLVLNSHLSDPELHMLTTALEKVNPEYFSWSGPDPDHHFSTAIVPLASEKLCAAVGTWSALRTLHLSSIAFCHDGDELAKALVEREKTLSRLGNTDLSPSLKVYINRAVFMHPAFVLTMTCSLMLTHLELTDVYQHSIWGPRLRRKDVEDALAQLPVDEDTKKHGLELIREVVRCRAQTERLIGGDRGDSQEMIEELS